MNTPRKNAAEFDEFVLRQQSTEIEAASVDWGLERDQWLDYLNVLYTSVEAFLKPYIDGGTIAVSYKDVLLNEENIGEYTARQMVLQIGKQHVVFTPIGTLLIGTKGRVDVEGAAGKARLILADRDAQRPQIKVTVKRDGDNPRPVTEPATDIDWTWKIATMPPQVSCLPPWQCWRQWKHPSELTTFNGASNEEKIRFRARFVRYMDTNKRMPLWRTTFSAPGSTALTVQE